MLQSNLAGVSNGQIQNPIIPPPIFSSSGIQNRVTVTSSSAGNILKISLEDGFEEYYKACTSSVLTHQTSMKDKKSGILDVKKITGA